MPVRDSVKLRRKSSSRAETSARRARRCSTATVSGSDMTAALTNQIWTMVPAPLALMSPEATAAPKGPRPWAVSQVDTALTPNSCQATIRMSKRRAAQTSSGSGTNASGRLCVDPNTTAVTAISPMLWATSSVRWRGDVPPVAARATGTMTSVEAACDAKTEPQLSRNWPTSNAMTVRAAPLAITTAPRREATTRRLKSSSDARRGMSSERFFRISPAITASPALATPNSAETGRSRPPVKLAAALATTTPRARAGHHERGAIATIATESPAAGHQDATAPPSGAKFTAPIPAR